MLKRDAIGQMQVDFRWPDGCRCVVTVELSAPWQTGPAEWRCEVDLNGIPGETTAMIGEDSLGVLSAGLNYLGLRIDSYRKTGVRVLYHDSDEDLLTDLLFPARAPSPPTP